MLKRIIVIGCCLLTANVRGFGLADCQLDNALRYQKLAEHLYGGALSPAPVNIRHGYVMSYDTAHNLPHWVAWHALKAYRDTPKRSSRWSTFRRDPEFPAVSDADYRGWYGSDDNFARGHLVPYYISGGDRDGDGIDAEYEGSLAVEDPDDACTVYEINAFSNITPQYHRRFNGESGLWYQLESALRELIDQGHEFHLFAGTVFMADKPLQTIGNRKSSSTEWHIGVPHGFFKVVVDAERQQALAFLFDHQQDVPYGCSLDAALEQCIVSFRELEQVTGLNFFPDLSEEQKQRLIRASSPVSWKRWQMAD